MIFFLQMLSILIVIILMIWSLMLNYQFILMIWIFLEISMWGSMTFFLSKKYNINNIPMPMLKFFSSQSISSIILCLSMLMMISYSDNQSFYEGLLIIVFLFSIFLKLGMFPFQEWMYEILLLMNSKLIFMILGLKKLLPIMIFILMNFYFNDLEIMKFIIFCNFFFIIWIFLNFKNFYFYLFASSIYHFMMFLTILDFLDSSNISFIYFLSYLFFFFFMICFLEKSKLFFPSIIPYNQKNWKIFLIMMSVSGFPPYMMFFVKIYLFSNFISYLGNMFIFFIILPMFIYLCSFIWMILSDLNSKSIFLLSSKEFIFEEKNKEENFLLWMMYFFMFFVVIFLF